MSLNTKKTTQNTAEWRKYRQYVVLYIYRKCCDFRWWRWQGDCIKIGKSFINLKKIWKSKSISTNTKTKLCKSCALSDFLYWAGFWRVIEKDINKLSGFHTGFLRKILRIFWPTSDQWNLHKMAKSTDMKTMLGKYRWIDHVYRKPRNNKSSIQMDLRRKKGRPKST